MIINMQTFCFLCGLLIEVNQLISRAELIKKRKIKLVRSNTVEVDPHSDLLHICIGTQEYVLN